MARGGLSSDPATRQRQLAALEAGREEARQRREAGLPWKRSEQRNPADAGDGRSSGRVVDGSYERGDRGRTKAGRQPAPPAKQRRESRREAGGAGEPAPRWARIGAGIFGIKIDD